MNKVVVCGNGPSLAEVDLPSISGVTTLGMNAAYRYWERIGWYPDIYCCLDDRVAVSHQDQILGLIHDEKCKVFFLHHSILQKYPGLAAHPSCVFLPSFDIQYANTALLRGSLGIPLLDPKMFWSQTLSKVTTGAYSVRFAAALGFTELLLLGIDARYVEVIQGARREDGIGLTMEETPAVNPNYFFADYQQKGDAYNLPTPPTHDGNLHSDVFHAIRDDFRGYAPEIQIYIGSKNSELYKQGVFEFRDLQTFLKGNRPRHPLDVTEFAERRAPTIPRTEIATSVFSGWFFMNGTRRLNPEMLEWPEGADQKSTANIILGKRYPFKEGTTVIFSANIRADRDCRLKVEANRFGEGPFESAATTAQLTANETARVLLAITLKNNQSAIKLAVSPESPVASGGLRIAYTDLVAH